MAAWCNPRSLRRPGNSSCFGKIAESGQTSLPEPACRWRNMGADSDLGWGDRDHLATEEVAAAKLHVLHLDPIKAKLGEKWERLSNLVHKLFERTLYQAQGPRDHFLLVDELSYVVTFHDLSLEEAGLACASVAQKVCELLFGSDINDIAVRSLVGPVSSALLSGKVGDAVRIAEILERRGGEIIVTPTSGDPGWRGPGQEPRRRAMAAAGMDPKST